MLAFNIIRAVPPACGGKIFGDTACVDHIWTPKVDKNLPSPNVYWIHSDGMLGFNGFRKYYGDAQRPFKDFLLNSDFAVNESAAFEGCHRTRSAVPALMCPDFYDSFLVRHLSSPDSATKFLDESYKYKSLLAWHRLCHNELYLSFERKGYHLFFVPETPNMFLYRFKGGRQSFDDIFTRLERNNFIASIFGPVIGNMCLRLSGGFFLSRFSAPPGTAWKAAEKNWPEYIRRADYGKIYSSYFREASAAPFQPSPRLVVFNLFACHFPYMYDENGKKTGRSATNTAPRDYPTQHRFTAKILKENIRMILARDPDAVIVLQADHGLHFTTPQQFREYFGQACDPAELWNGVLSAVRIPEKYRDGTEDMMMKTPLNISRYLINRFVGRGNCRYLK